MQQNQLKTASSPQMGKKRKQCTTTYAIKIRGDNRRRLKRQEESNARKGTQLRERRI